MYQSRSRPKLVRRNPSSGLESMRQAKPMASRDQGGFYSEDDDEDDDDSEEEEEERLLSKRHGEAVDDTEAAAKKPKPKTDEEIAQ